MKIDQAGVIQMTREHLRSMRSRAERIERRLELDDPAP